MNKYHKRIQELGRTLPGWVKVGALALGVGVGTGTGGWSPGIEKARAGKYKENTVHTHNTTVNVTLRNRYVNFENAGIFLPKTLIFVLSAVALLYFALKKSKNDHNG